MTDTARSVSLPWIAGLLFIAFLAGLAVSLLWSDPPPRPIVTIPLSAVEPQAGEDTGQKVEEEIANLKTELSTTRDDLETVAKELADAQASAARELDAASAALAEAQQNAEAAADRNRIYNDELTEMRTELAEAKRQRDSLAERTADLEKQNRELTQELERLRAQPGFLTAPLTPGR